MDDKDREAYGQAFRLMGDAFHLLADAMKWTQDRAVPTEKDAMSMEKAAPLRGETYQGARFLWVQIMDDRWAPRENTRWEVYATQATPDVTQRWLRDLSAKFVAYHQTGYADIYLKANSVGSALDAAEAIISACEASEART